jgi:hypothetical protein
MGHQVNFFALPTDLPAIEAAIRTTGDVCFVEDRTPRAKPAELGTLAIEPGDMGRRPLGAYIVRRSDLGAVKTRFVSTQGYWLIESADSPVIEFDRCFFDGNVLRRGRAYFASDLRFRPEPPRPDFVKWGDRVLARIKKVLTRAPELPPRIYVSADALQWIREQSASASGGALEFRGGLRSGSVALAQVRDEFGSDVGFSVPREVSSHLRSYARIRGRYRR